MVHPRRSLADLQYDATLPRVAATQSRLWADLSRACEGAFRPAATTSVICCARPADFPGSDASESAHAEAPRGRTAGGGF